MQILCELKGCLDLRGLPDFCKTQDTGGGAAGGGRGGDGCEHHRQWPCESLQAEVLQSSILVSDCPVQSPDHVRWRVIDFAVVNVLLPVKQEIIAQRFHLHSHVARWATHAPHRQRRREKEFMMVRIFKSFLSVDVKAQDYQLKSRGSLVSKSRKNNNGPPANLYEQQLNAIQEA